MSAKQSNKVNQSAVADDVKPDESLASKAIEPITPQAPVETPQAPVEVLPPVIQSLILPGNRIALQAVNDRLHKAACNAGRMSGIAKQLGIGRVAKDMSGGGTLIPTLACLSDLESLGKLGDTKERIKSAKDEIRALNMIMDGFALLGLAKRRES